MEYGSRLQNAVHLSKDIHRLDHVLDGDCYDRGIKTAIFQRQYRVGVDVVNDALVKLRILSEFNGIQAQAYQVVNRQVGRHVGAPA